MDYISILILIAFFISLWIVFRKMGRKGWEGIIPIYNLYILFQMFLEGKSLWLLLIPLYNIYLLIRLGIKIAHAFGQSNGFGIGLALLFFIFYPVLAFGDYTYNG